MGLLLALDEGTSSCRTVAFDLDGNVKCVSQQEFQQHYPQAGWVEHDATEIRDRQFETLRTVLEEIGGPKQVAGLGVTNQRETVVIWDRRSGKPISRAIVWQDRRTASMMESIAQDEAIVQLIRERTGLIPDPYFSASKIQWMLDHVDGARAAADEGHLAFGTIESWLLWSLTDGATHATDASNAARTMLYDINRGQWDPDLLGLFDIPESILPEVVPCAGRFGAVKMASGLEVTGMIGDQQSALFGQGCLQPGDAKTTYGTGCFLLMNTGEESVASTSGLLTTVGWQLPDGTVNYALEGSVFMGGATIQWLRDGLGIIDSAPQVNELAASVDSADGVVLVPAFAGLGAPHWDSWGRAAIMGMTRGTTAAHIARATLEGIAMSVADVLQSMERDASLSLHELRVDGGAAASDLLMQIQSDVLGTTVLRPKMLETTAWGAAAMSGIGSGTFLGPEDAAGHWHLDRRFEPDVDAAYRASKLAIWARAVERVKGWAREDNNDT
ncbi:MAG: glycerol kinase GlpK [Phycisphaerales bacterium]|nr:glycerol kinase GlpK [Phycisphaerales bacterium]